MTSVPFNVGLHSNAVGGDPYDEDFRPASDGYIGAQVRSDADGMSRPGNIYENPVVAAALKSVAEAEDE